ncbi:uncharacterized protein LOC143827238 isoform X2 [Paroedura picta]|uniref:uncharacterized protein LOC143827238 isoform X2 n=1 Tax=Paroedura picta TaxID=143630 RepID=UPI00405627AC
MRGAWPPARPSHAPSSPPPLTAARRPTVVLPTELLGGGVAGLAGERESEQGLVCACASCFMVFPVSALIVSSQPILWRPRFLLPLTMPSIKDFSKESDPTMCPKRHPWLRSRPALGSKEVDTPGGQGEASRGATQRTSCLFIGATLLFSCDLRRGKFLGREFAKVFWGEGGCFCNTAI